MEIGWVVGLIVSFVVGTVFTVDIVPMNKKVARNNKNWSNLR